MKYSLFTGNHFHQSSGNLLGCGDVGAFCYHNGGKMPFWFGSYLVNRKSQVLKEGPPPQPSIVRPSHNRVLSNPAIFRRSSNERQPLIRRRSLDEYECEPGVDEAGPVAPMAGGTVLGIHNLAIVMPQFIVCLEIVRHRCKLILNLY